MWPKNPLQDVVRDEPHRSCLMRFVPHHILQNTNLMNLLQNHRKSPLPPGEGQGEGGKTCPCGGAPLTPALSHWERAAYGTSLHDTKTMKLAGVRLYGDLYRSHMCPWRAVMAPGDECVYGALLPFHHRLNIATEAVTYPA